MPVPKQSELHRPVLELANELGSSLSRRDAVNRLIGWLNITEAERRERVPGGGQTRFENRTYWAISKLKMAGLLRYPAKGEFQITPEGAQFLLNHSGVITIANLNGLIREKPGDSSDGLHVLEEVSPDDRGDVNPDEQMERSHGEYLAGLADEILETVKAISPESFERLVNRLLAQMGYGEISQESGYRGDQGIDGILNQDALGLEKVYVQAKRYAGGQVPELDIRNFSGSLNAKGAGKGVFITTSDFSAPARRQASAMKNQMIRLIDGQELAQLMIKYSVGLITKATYEIKKLDDNYFAEL